MNYFELHIGDYDSATAHLSALEDGLYGRLLRTYYRTEKPLPTDIKAVARLVRASSKAERDIVAALLEEFFVLEEDGWHNPRCDAEIGRYADGEPEREIKKANEANRLKRHREERARLFKALTDAGHHAAWNVGMNELRELVKRHCPPFPETAPATPATATHTPIPNTQYPEEEIQGRATSPADGARAPDPDHPPTQPTQAGLTCRAMRSKGVADTNPGDPRLLALLSQGATLAEFEGLAEEAVRRKIGKPFAWILATLPARRADAAQVQLPPTPEQQAAADPMAWTRDRSAVQTRALNAGMPPWNAADAATRRGPSWEQYLAEVIARTTEGVSA